MNKHSIPRKKLLMVLYQFPPCSDVGAFRPIRFIKHLGTLGWHPVVLAPSNGVHNAYDPGLEREILDYCTIYRAPLLPRFAFGERAAYVKRGWPRLLWRIWNRVALPDGAVSWLPAAVDMGVHIVKKECISLILASGQPFSTFIIANSIKKRTNTKLIVEYRDPWTLNPFHKGSKVRLMAERCIEKRILAHADAAVFLTQESALLHQNAYGHVLNENKCCTITNSFERNDIDGQSDISTKEFLLVHAGNLYGNRDPEVFLKGLSMAVIRNPELRRKTRVLFYGIFDSVKINRVIQDLKLNNVIELHPRIPQNELLPIMRKSHLLIIINSYGPGHHVFIPAKFFDYLKMGRPILCLTEDGALKRAMVETGAGIVADPKNPNQVASALQKMFERTFIRVDPFHTDRNRLMQYESRYTTAKLATLCDRLINGQRDILNQES